MIGGKELAPLWNARLRFVAAGALLVAFVLATRRSFPAPRSFAGAMLYGAVAFAASFAFIYP